MTFTEFLRQKKGVDPDGKDLGELMEEYYDEYAEMLRNLKDGCGAG